MLECQPHYPYSSPFFLSAPRFILTKRCSEYTRIPYHSPRQLWKQKGNPLAESFQGKNIRNYKSSKLYKWKTTKCPFQDEKLLGQQAAEWSLRTYTECATLSLYHGLGEQLELGASDSKFLLCPGSVLQLSFFKNGHFSFRSFISARPPWWPLLSKLCCVTQGQPEEWGRKVGQRRQRPSKQVWGWGQKEEGDTKAAFRTGSTT